MFAVKPLPDKKLRCEICADLGTDYFEGSYSYLAAELADDRSTVVAVIGICQFYMTDADGARRGEIVSLVPAEGREGDQAMIVMCRAVMNFMWRAGCKNVILKNSAGPAELLKRCGLIKREEGYFADLDEFYTSPCHYNKENRDC